MPLIYLIVLVFAVFLMLWCSDLYFTVQSVKKLGSGVELNPVIRFVLGVRGRYIWFFKILEISVFSYIIWIISSLDEERTFSLLLGLIFVYSLVVLAGLKVYIELTGKSTPALFLFFGILLALLLFIQLNHTEYQNKIMISNALYECNSAYNDLSSKCVSNDSFKDEGVKEVSKYQLNLSMGRWIK